jgi:hypothetical protein
MNTCNSSSPLTKDACVKLCLSCNVYFYSNVYEVFFILLAIFTSLFQTAYCPLLIFLREWFFLVKVLNKKMTTYQYLYLRKH